MQDLRRRNAAHTAVACLVTLVAFCLGETAWAAAAALPAKSPDASILAWIRFENTKESYQDTPYLWLGDTVLDMIIDVRPQPGHALEILWGAKKDAREAALTVNGKSVAARGGGYSGFRWLKVPLPAGLTGERYEVKFAAAGEKPAFMAEVRLVAPGMAEAVPPPDLKKPSSKITLKTDPFAPSRVPRAPAPSKEAFPDMRPVWDTPAPPPAVPIADERLESFFRQAEANARCANEAFYRCRRFVDGWLNHADPKSGLIPRNLTASRDLWNAKDSAADNYPFMVLTAAMTDRPLLEGRMLDMLRAETRLTSRIDRLPDDFLFSKQGFATEKPNLDAIIFGGAEYVKDGLIPLTEWLGPSPWSERAVGIIDDIWKHAPVDTPFGKIPTLNFEVNGDLLQACSRLYWFTGDRKYLDWAIRLGDYYLLGDHHPTRDMKELSLGDHSCEVINGLSELYVACASAAPEKREAYRKPLHELYDRLLEIARNEHGLIYLKVNTRTGEHSAALTDNWGYNYDGLYSAFLLDHTAAYRDAVRKCLGNLKEHYTGKGGMCQSNTADGYADSIEGAITLLNREPAASAAEWADTEIKTMWGKQQPDGVIEGWHGDGNSARTSLMYALWKTQGVTVQPWRADVRFGAVRQGDTVYLSVIADKAWAGKLVFDKQRHKLNMHLPLDYPRINQFPEWFTAEADDRYVVRDAAAAKDSPATGRALQDGLPVDLKPGVQLRLIVSPAPR
jgi:hypothetical protein